MIDEQRFDQLTRVLASGTSRRRLFKAIAGSAVAGAAGLLRRHGSRAGDKVLVCHRTGSETNPVVLIEVSVNAIPAHEAHGDVIAPDFQNDPNNCGGCLISCDDGDPCTIDTCEGGVCVNTPIVCDDGNPCTVDACVEGECVFTPVEGRTCDDGDACTENDACDATGACVGTPVVNCDGDTPPAEGGDGEPGEELPRPPECGGPGDSCTNRSCCLWFPRLRCELGVCLLPDPPPEDEAPA